jgi:hypothetical protein
MDDAGFILTTYVVTFASIAAYALYVVRRGRRTSQQLPDDVKPWVE